MNLPSDASHTQVPHCKLKPLPHARHCQPPSISQEVHDTWMVLQSTSVAVELELVVLLVAVLVVDDDDVDVLEFVLLEVFVLLVEFVDVVCLFCMHLASLPSLFAPYLEPSHSYLYVIQVGHEVQPFSLFNNTQSS